MFSNKYRPGSHNASSGESNSRGGGSSAVGQAFGTSVYHVASRLVNVTGFASGALISMRLTVEDVTPASSVRVGDAAQLVGQVAAQGAFDGFELAVRAVLGQQVTGVGTALGQGFVVDAEGLTHFGGAGLGDLIREVLAPYRAAEGRAHRFTIEGENIRLSPKATLALGMAFNELAANAVKYGALSNDAGTISVKWTMEAQPDGRWLCLHWRESGGPTVAMPQRKGFGSRLIERVVRVPVVDEEEERLLGVGLRGESARISRP